MLLSVVYFSCGILGAVGIGYLYFSYRRFTKEVDDRLKHTSYWW